MSDHGESECRLCSAGRHIVKRMQEADTNPLDAMHVLVAALTDVIAYSDWETTPREDVLQTVFLNIRAAVDSKDAETREHLN